MARIDGVGPELEPALRQRLRSLGVRSGAEVTALRRAPLGSPWLVRGRRRCSPAPRGRGRDR